MKTTEDTATDPAAGPAPDQAPGRSPSPGPGPGGDGPGPEPEADADRPAPPPQSALDAARELFEHLPPSFRGTLFAGGPPQFGGSLVGGDQHAMSGGQVTGDVFSGSKTEVHHHTVYTGGRTRRLPGEVPRADIDRLMESFQPGDHFAAAETCLRESRLVLLRGARSSGRRAASLALLRAVGVESTRVLDAAVADDLPEQDAPGHGYVLWDLRPDGGREQLESRLLTLRGKLAKNGGYLVITTEAASGLSWTVDWTPPPQQDLLAAHLRTALLRTGEAVDGEAVDGGDLLALPATASFLGAPRTPQEVADYALLLARHALGEVSEADLLRSDRAAVEEQVTRWFADGGPELREQAFLISLAVFDQAAYALAAEYGDSLHGLLQRIEDPDLPVRANVFGTSVRQRLAAARATMSTETETVAWGVIQLRKAAFDDPRTGPVLLRQVWLEHPSARPALLGWMNALAADEDPVVRAHAAAATAVLAEADLPSVMPRLLAPWAASPRYRLRNQAINSLALLAFDTETVAVPQILGEWCRSDDPQTRWTGIRGHGLIGALAPEQALRDIGDLVDRSGGTAATAGREAEDEAAVTATCLLLLTSGRSQVLARLADWLHPAGPRSALAVTAFTTAGRIGEDTPLGWPALLRWYALGPATAGGPQSVTTLAEATQQRDRQHIVDLWRAALSTRTHTDAAAELMREWIRTTTRDPACEQPLGELLRQLGVTGTERDRLSHLLRGLGRANRDTPLAEVCRRLLTAAELPDPDAAGRR